MPEKNTPRDFFLHAGAFVALYLGAIALITLLFSVINYAVPDPLRQMYYSDPYSGPMRFAIASLIILAPLAVYLFFRIQRDTRVNPERRSLGVRKWLTYITLFIAGATVIGDLIVLMNSFLGGALPTAFLLKVLVILGVMGAGFGYFYFDIKGYWVTHADYSRYAGFGVLVVVLASIVGGMTLMGSPTKQRALSIDNQQVMALQQIQSEVVNYWQNTRKLPATLGDIENDLGSMGLPQSPEGRPSYEYSVKGGLSFELCATFEEASVSDAYGSMQSGMFTEGEKWDHEAGRACFTRTINPALFPPVEEQPVVTVPVKPTAPAPVKP